jgi:hypothetical protein
MAATDAGLGLGFSSSSAQASFLHFLTRDYVSNVIHDTRNNNARILSLIPESTKYVGGRHIRERAMYGRNPRQFNAVGDNGNFPDPGQRRMAWYAYRGRQQFGRFILDGKLVRAMSNGAGDVSAMEMEIQQFLDDYELDRARMLYSDGSGRLCEAAGAGTAASVDVPINLQINQDIATGLSAPGASATGMANEPPTRWLTPGMRVLFVTNVGVPKCIANVVSITDADTAVFTVLSFNAAAFTDFSSLAAGDWIVKTGSTDNSSVERMRQNSAYRSEPMGLMGILGYGGPMDGTGRAAEVGATFASEVEGTDNGAFQWGGTDDRLGADSRYFQGLACIPTGLGWNSDLTFNQGVVNHNGGSVRTPSENLLMQIIDEVEERNSAEIMVWLSSYAAKRVYSSQLTGEKRYVNTTTLPGGWNRLMVGPGGIPWLVDRLFPKNNILGLSLEQGGFTNWLTEPLSWATEQGANIWQYLQDMDRYQARTVEESTLGVGVRDRCGVRIMDIEES